MTVIIKIIISVAIALIFALFSKDYISNQEIRLAFDIHSFLLFVTAGLLTAGLTSLIKGNAEDADNAPTKTQRKSPVRSGAPREQGKVKWFNFSKGFGFITRDQGDDIFVHYRSIRGKGKRTLYDGQAVEFIVTKGDKGLQAEDVDILDKDESKN